MSRRRTSVLAGLGVLTVAFIMRTWVGHTLWVRTEAMVPTVNSHEWIWVMDRAPELGDVVQVQLDGASGLYRVAATEGQSLEIRKGRLFVDGVSLDTGVAKTVSVPDSDCGVEALPATQVNIGTHGFYAVVGGDQPAVVVSPGTIFLLGDNRPIAGDSRAWGPWPIGSVSGVATRVISSWNACESRIRWRRTWNSIE